MEEEGISKDREALGKRIARTFRTVTGKALAEENYLKG